MSRKIPAFKVVNKSIDGARIVVSGIGAAGMATARIMVAAGARNVIACDRTGTLFVGRTANMNLYKERLAEITNPGGELNQPRSTRTPGCPRRRPEPRRTSGRRAERRTSTP